MLVSIRSSVQSLDVFVVQIDGSCSVLNNFFPIAERIIAGRSVGVENRIWLAKDSFAVKLNRFIVILAAIGFIPRDL